MQNARRLPKDRRPNRPPPRFRPAVFETLESRALLAADIVTGLVHHWKFDETTGDVAADVAGSSNGALVNWIAGQPKWEPGRVGGALRFSSSGSYMITQPPPISGSFAIAFWLNEGTRQGGYARIFTAKAGNVVFVANQDNRGVSYSQNNDFYTFSADPPTFNYWDHYAINFNNATGQGIIYRNGAPVAIGAFADTATAQAWVLGHHSDLANHAHSLHGALDDFRVYDRVLKDEDIAQLASMGVPEPTHQGPVNHWTFDETSGFTAHDVAGNADGTLLNWNATEPRWEAGKVGGALRFSTADNAVVTSPVTTGAQWTKAFWLNVQAKTGINPRVVEPWAYINLENNRGIGFTSRNQHTFDPTPVRVNQWEHYAITYDTIQDVGTIYRNGVAVKSGYFGDNAPASAWVFGHQSGDLGNHNDSLDGLLDDLRHYDRLLSPSEIQSLAGIGEPPPLPAGLIHHWTFDETIGIIAADIVGGNDGELRNYGAAQSKFVPGKIGRAISFTDADDLVITKTPITEDQYTFSFWLNQTGGGGFNPRLINPGDEDWFMLWEFADRGILFGGTDVWDPRQATPNTWEHYAITLDQTINRVEFYRDGVLVASGNYPDKPPPIKQWVMGHSGTLTHHVDTLHGMLDEMRVYDRVLSAAEVQALAQFQPLEALPDAYSTREDITLVVSTAQGVLKNDSTAGTGTRAVIDVLPTRGQLTLNANGGFTYTPSNDFSGTDSFTYHLVAGLEVSATTTVTLTITPVNDPPSFGLRVPEFVISDEQPRVFRANGAAVASERLLAWMMNRTAGPLTALDEAGQTLTVSMTNDKPGLFTVQPSENQGMLQFTPAPNARGTAVVTVWLQDSGGTADGGVDTAVQTFVITVVKPHPLHNVADPSDVIPDGTVAPGDALAAINFMNAFGAQAVPQSAAIGPPFLDVTGDNFVAPNDALAIINQINANGGATIPSIPAAATFVELDNSTQGSWQSQYGRQGYALNSSVTTLPPYAELSFTGGLTDLYDYVQAASTSDPRALRHPTSSGRFAAEWTGDHGFTLNINLTDGQTHRVALYMLDWGPSGRSQQLDVFDANTGGLLDTQTVESFGDGSYLVWNLRGNLRIRFTNLANGLNTVLSGVFFD